MVFDMCLPLHLRVANTHLFRWSFVDFDSKGPTGCQLEAVLLFYSRWLYTTSFSLLLTQLRGCLGTHTEKEKKKVGGSNRVREVCTWPLGL